MKVLIAEYELRFKSIELPKNCPNCQASFTNREDLNLEETVLESFSAPRYIYKGRLFQPEDFDGGGDSKPSDTVLHYECTGCRNWSTLSLTQKTKARKKPAKKSKRKAKK